MDTVGDIGDRTRAHIHTIDFFNLLADIRGSHTAAVHADDRLLELIAYARTFGNQPGLKLTLAIPGNVENHIAQRLGLYFFGIGTITAVAGIMALTAVLFIAQVFIQLCLEHLFNALPVQIVEKGFKIVLVFKLLEKSLGRCGC